MLVPVQVTYRGTRSSTAIEGHIRRRAAKLDRFAGRITACHVTVDGPHGHHRKGNLWSVRVDVAVPGHEVVVSRDSDDDHTHEDLHVAIDDAFDAACRLLDEQADAWQESRRH